MNNLTKLPVQIKTVHLINHRLDSFYPIIGGISDKEVQRKINKTIIRTVYALMQEQGYFDNDSTTVTASYEIKNNQGGILSLSLINYAFSGGAHGLTLIRSLTFNTETGTLYSLKDLFKPDADYVARLSELVRGQIRERNIPLLVDFTQIRPDQDFYIADKSLVLYFQLYELSAYAYGFPYFPISVYEIQDIIDEDGPLGKMLGSF
ncbi:MAG: DUF3298 and DUF4163 domain-containing protein [Bacillota bacterium]|jgi:hypothetical protein|nr:DUF3298 and DUF4163 domain-containing protein [Clostridia bacterium]